MLSFGVDTLIYGVDYDAIYSFSILYLLVSLIQVPLQCIAEEYVFRSFFLQTFGSWFKIPVLAIVLQSIVFTVIHGYDDIGLIEIFVCGCIFGFMVKIFQKSIIFLDFQDNYFLLVKKF